MNHQKIAMKPLMMAIVIAAFGSGSLWAACNPTTANRPVCPAAAAPENATFIDPTVVVAKPASVSIGKHTYIGPFAVLASTGTIKIGEKTNLQDSVVLAGTKAITLGDEVILAHGALVKGAVTIGRTEVVGEHNAAFVGFNSLIDGATVEHDAMVLHLARVAPGITIKHGKVVLSGKNITTQAQADNTALGKVIPISDALRAFMDGVLHVNETFAREYTRMYQGDPNTVTGINYDPGSSDFNPNRDLPTLAGHHVQAPAYRNRIIGAVEMADSLAVVSDDDGPFSSMISLRADEGEPFHLGHVAAMSARSTFHALEHTGLDLHDGISFGFRSLVHGGSSAATQNNPHANTVVGDNTKIGNHAVVFRSVLGHDVKVGCGSLVDGATLANGAVVAPRTVTVGNNAPYAVEWNPGC